MANYEKPLYSLSLPKIKDAPSTLPYIPFTYFSTFSHFLSSKLGPVPMFTLLYIIRFLCVCLCIHVCGRVMGGTLQVFPCKETEQYMLSDISKYNDIMMVLIDGLGSFTLVK